MSHFASVDGALIIDNNYGGPREQYSTDSVRNHQTIPPSSSIHAFPTKRLIRLTIQDLIIALMCFDASFIYLDAIIHLIRSLNLFTTAEEVVKFLNSASCVVFCLILHNLVFFSIR